MYTTIGRYKKKRGRKREREILQQSEGSEEGEREPNADRSPIKCHPSGGNRPHPLLPGLHGLRFQGHSAGHVVQQKTHTHLITHATQAITRTCSHSFIKSTETLEVHLNRLATQADICSRTSAIMNISWGAQPLENPGMSWCQRWLAPAATGPKVQMCARG